MSCFQTCFETHTLKNCLFLRVLKNVLYISACFPFVLEISSLSAHVDDIREINLLALQSSLVYNNFSLTVAFLRSKWSIEILLFECFMNAQEGC